MGRRRGGAEAGADIRRRCNQSSRSRTRASPSLLPLQLSAERPTERREIDRETPTPSELSGAHETSSPAPSPSPAVCGTGVTMSTVRRSSRINESQSKDAQKKLLPKGGVTKRSGASSKTRASWNADLEKALVDLLLEHNTPQYKGQNGWSCDVWGKIVKKFQDSHPHVNYTRGQIKDKEKELKREYKMLKEARQQSGVSWNKKRCMIEAEQALWDNLIISFPKIGKFRTNKAFPLFDALGELYDGQLAEGTYNFTSTQPTQTQVECNPEVSSVDVTRSHPDIGETSVDVQDNTRGGMQEANFQERVAGHEEPQPTVAAAPSTSIENEPKKRRSNGEVAAMMEKYIEMKTKQIDSKQILRNMDDFSIKNCIARLSRMQVSQGEKVKAMRVFKNAENREIFICADMETALMWLRAEME